MLLYTFLTFYTKYGLWIMDTFVRPPRSVLRTNIVRPETDHHNPQTSSVHFLKLPNMKYVTVLFSVLFSTTRDFEASIRTEDKHSTAIFTTFVLNLPLI